jgi:hypothetical protein
MIYAGTDVWAVQPWKVRQFAVGQFGFRSLLYVNTPTVIPPIGPQRRIPA